MAHMHHNKYKLREHAPRRVDTIPRTGRDKRVDFYQPARVDRAAGIETTLAALAAMVDEGKFYHIGVDKCSAETLRRAHAVHASLHVLNRDGSHC